MNDNASQQNSWIFQASPKIFDLRGALDGGVKRFVWSARQHQAEIATGDRVYLWQAGSTGGLMATATVIAPVTGMTPFPEEVPYFIQPDTSQSEPRIAVQVIEVLENALSRNDLKAEPLLANMSLFKMAQSTNFKLSPVEASTLAAFATRGETFADTVRRYHAEGIVYRSTVQGKLYRVQSTNEAGCNIERLSASEPARCTFQLFESRREQLRDAGGQMPRTELDGTAAIRAVLLQAPDFGLSEDRQSVIDISQRDAAAKNFCEQLRSLKTDRSSGLPKLYKLAMIRAVIDAVVAGDLTENQIVFDTIEPHYRRVMESLGQPIGGIHQAVEPFYHLTGDLFWCLSYHAPDNPFRDTPGSATQLNERVRFASIKDSYWRLLFHEKYRLQILETLRETWWPHESPVRSLRFWWVNQGQTYRAEREGGFVWAPQANESGKKFFHWDNVSRIEGGDVVVHYSRGEIVSLSVVQNDATAGAKPDSMDSSPWHAVGWIAHTNYCDLQPPVPLSDVASPLQALNIDHGPINSVGGVNQGYLYELPRKAIDIILDTVNKVPEPVLAAMNGQLDLSQTLKEQFEQIVRSPVGRLMVSLRRRRAAQIREILSGDQSVDLESFNTEIWSLESKTMWQEREITGQLLIDRSPISDDQAKEYRAALDEQQIELHGNYCWGSGAKIYGAQLKADQAAKEEYIQQAIAFLNDASLSPIETAESVMTIPGFGPNTATGLVMLFHPHEFGIWNKPSKQAMQKLGRPCKTLSEFEEAAAALKDEVGAEDFLELDWFLYRIVTDDDNPVLPPPVESGTKYWAMSLGEGARLWPQCLDAGLIAIGVDYLGDMRAITSQADFETTITKERDDGKRAYNDALACYQFTYEMKPGDFVFAKRGRDEILGYGQIESEYIYDEERAEYTSIRRVKWLAHGSWELPEGVRVPIKTLTDVTGYSRLLNYILPKVKTELDRSQLKVRDPFTLDDACEGLFVPKDDVSQMLGALGRKKNVILQGPPGVGKTFIARRLAYALIGFKEPAQVEMVQFHQSYAYEDFIQGWRPNADGGFQLKNGLFHQFCRAATEKPDEAFVFIIDEINRGNLSKIFGELLMLLEADKRGEKFEIPLTYSTSIEDRFSIPKNVHVIGMMNTADRSLAMVDYALRRRFTFIDLVPQFQTAAFREHLDSCGVENEVATQVIERMATINEKISSDTVNLGPGFQIGHSFFCPQQEEELNAEWYEDIIETEIAPLLREYWFDQPEKANEMIQDLLA